MKKLFLIRHAKSSWDDANLDDFDRPLNKRGLKDAPKMGKRLKMQKIYPDMILSSSAMRAKSTANLVCDELKYESRFVLFDELYHANENKISDILRQIPDEVKTIFLFGHNPGFNEFASKYVKFYENIPTCGVLEILFDVQKWDEIAPENCTFVSFDFPKNSI